MQFIKDDININFIGNRKKAYAFSLALIVISILLLIYRGGPNLGVDFTGGILIQVKMAKAHTPAEIKEALTPINLQDSIIQEFGEKDLFEYLIRVQNPDIDHEGLEAKVISTLKEKFGESAEMRSFEMVGPKVGSDLRDKASLAILCSLLLIAIYISWRFEMQLVKSIIMAAALGFVIFIASKMGASMVWISIIVLIATLILLWVLNLKYALGAIIALVHDVTITVGAFALTDREVSLGIIAALLTIIGYSLNDTIVVFDRIRENIARFKKRDLAEVMNGSINQTLSRTILTSATTLVAVVALYVLGGAVIHDFAFAMLVGIVIGTYSSIYVASPIILAWEGNAEKKK
jgi:preprotein translocase subunit SecF